MAIQKDPNYKPEDPVNPQHQELLNEKEIVIKHSNLKALSQQKKISQLKQDLGHFDNSELKDPVNIKDQITQAKKEKMVMKGKVYDLQNSNKTQKSLVKQYITGNDQVNRLNELNQQIMQER